MVSASASLVTRRATSSSVDVLSPALALTVAFLSEPGIRKQNLSVPKTLRFENAETLRFLFRGPKNR